ncbi:MAG: transglutaminase-like domain-containing protein [Chloroflexi bacterium]|nr:transglutaminase-like domain-containing protein [Chloroflexota bacterium]
MIRKPKRVRLHQEHAEHAGVLRVIAAMMAWAAGIALGIATGDLVIALILTAVITSGHLVSWRTRLWRSARWQIMLLVPTALVVVLLVPSLPQAFQGDWLHPMRYLLLLQALTSFYLHSRASLYTAQMLSAIVLLVSSQLAFDSLFLTFFFAFFLLQLVFLASATRVDAVRGAVAVHSWPNRAQRMLWGAAGVGLIAVASIGAFLLLPWGSLSAGGGNGSMLPLTGEARPGSSEGVQDGPSESMPRSGPDDPALNDPEEIQQAIDELLNNSDGSDIPVPNGELGGLLGQGGTPGADGAASPLFGTEDGFGGSVPGDPGPNGEIPNPTVMQVRSPVSTYWRGQTYSVFDGEQWLPDGAVRFSTPTRSAKARYPQTYFVKQQLPMPVLGYTPLGWQPVGDTKAPIIEPGDVYRVISERRNFHPAVLSRATSANVINRGPDEFVSESVKELAAQITLGRSGALSKSLAVTQFLRSNYTYAASLDPFSPLQSIEQFLYGDHKLGNAFDFAAAQTALAVASGLEARLVTGYLPGELDPLSGTYVVRASDAHAWTEINFRDRIGWVPFDGNPREDGQANTTTTRNGAAGAVASLFDQRVGDQVRDAVKIAIEQSLSFGARVIGPAAVGVAVVAIVLAVRWLLGRRRPRVPYSLLEAGGRRDLIRAYERLMKQVSKYVPPRSTDETVDQYFARVSREFPSVGEELVWLRDKLNEVAYRPTEPNAAHMADARIRMGDLRRTIRTGAGG